jgi:ribosome-binding ATPase
MSLLRVGIVGLPNAGKTTLFNALSRAGAQVAAYPFTTVDPNVGVVAIPDKRLDRIADLAGCERRVPATVRFVDIAGLVEGASKGEGLGNRFLANIREVDAVVHVIRAFQSTDVSHVVGSVDPVRDAELIETELRIADLEVLSRLISKARQAAKSGDRDCLARVECLQRTEEEMGGTGCLTNRELMARELLQLVPDAQLLSLKPTLIVLNVGESPSESENYERQIEEWAEPRDIPVVTVNAEIEAELAELEPAEAVEFEKEMGIEEESLARIAEASYRLLGLITFFSIDSGECRAWPVPEGSSAAHAAGRIHTDFEKGFVKAEVVHEEEFLACGSFSGARDSGALRLEGREYIVQDGDVMHFKFAT